MYVTIKVDVADFSVKDDTHYTYQKRNMVCDVSMQLDTAQNSNILSIIDLRKSLRLYYCSRK